MLSHFLKIHHPLWTWVVCPLISDWLSKSFQVLMVIKHKAGEVCSCHTWLQQRQQWPLRFGGELHQSEQRLSLRGVWKQNHRVGIESSWNRQSRDPSSPAAWGQAAILPELRLQLSWTTKSEMISLPLPAYSYTTVTVNPGILWVRSSWILTH